MSDNPYAPPRSRVDDIVLPHVLESPPAQVVMAIRLAAINYVLGLLPLFVSWDYYSQLQSTGSMIVGQLFGLVLALWIYYKIYVGRNWARITLLVIAALTLLMNLSAKVRDLLMAEPTVAKRQMIVGLVISLIILWLLFISPGRHWFAKHRTNLPHESLERTSG